MGWIPGVSGLISFSNTSKPTPGSTQPPAQWIMEPLTQGSKNWAVNLTTDLHQVLKVSKEQLYFHFHTSPCHGISFSQHRDNFTVIVSISTK